MMPSKNDTTAPSSRPKKVSCMVTGRAVATRSATELRRAL